MPGKQIIAKNQWAFSLIGTIIKSLSNILIFFVQFLTRQCLFSAAVNVVSDSNGWDFLKFSFRLATTINDVNVNLLRGLRGLCRQSFVKESRENVDFLLLHWGQVFPQIFQIEIDNLVV